MAAKVISLILRLLIAAVFIYAGLLKIWDFDHGSATPQFYEDIANYQFAWLSSDLAMLTAVYLPWLEVLAGLALLGPWLRLGALALCAGMTLVFLGALSSAWHRDLDVTCGCFGRGEANRTDFPVAIARDVALLAAIAIAWWLEARRARRK